MGEKVIIDWEQLGIEPPEGEQKAETLKPREAPAPDIRRGGDSLKAIESRHATDATFAPEAALAAERQAIDAKLQGLEEEAEDVAGGTLGTKERNARLEALERTIEDLGIEAALLDEAIGGLEAGDPEAALNWFSAREVEAAARSAAAEDELEAAAERLKEVGAAKDAEGLVEAAAALNDAKVAADAAARAHRRLADQKAYLELKKQEAA